MNFCRKSFYSSEERCGFLVSEEMKKLWSKQLELLSIFIDVCNKHGLKYSLYAGSMLGAVRHNGYIPWDDDLDVCMERKDYDLFLEIAPKELPEYIFLQTALTERNWPCAFAKLRDSSTAAIQKVYVDSHALINQGIFIDIFPLDFIFTDEKKREKIYKKYKCNFKILSLSQKLRLIPFLWNKRHDSLLHKCLHFFNVTIRNCLIIVVWPICYFWIMIHGGYEKYQKKVEDIFRNLPKEQCDGICDCSFCALFNPHAKVYKKEWFNMNNCLNVSFEFLSVTIPQKYDEILTAKFGNWHKMVRGGAYHSFLEFSIEKDYKSILVSRYGYSKSEFCKK